MNEHPVTGPDAASAGTADPTETERLTVVDDSLTRADPARISKLIDALGEIGRDPRGGVSRLAFTPYEREAHELVGGTLEELGLSVRQDAIGNTLAVREGAVSGRPMLAIGSHLDSVPRGGRFDGAAGVVAMVELMHLLETDRVTTQHPFLGVAFTGEEGARFGEPCLGSKAVAGILDDRDLGAIHDAEGTTLADAMTALGLDPDQVSRSRWDPGDFVSYFELHIEQGRVLEESEIPVGILDMVSGSTRLWLTLEGRAGHSGATPMADRRDALTAAAEIALMIESVANDPFHRGLRATVGRLQVRPDSITTIPGSVRMSVDIRDVDGDRQRRTAAEVVERARSICRRRTIGLSTEVMADTSPTVLPIWLRRIVSNVCVDLGVQSRVMSIGATHDAQIIAREIPAAMVLVPSREGLSHVPEEWTSSADIALGVDVLYRTMLELDRFVAERPEVAAR